MDTLVISSCGRFTIHIKRIPKRDGLWIIMIGRRRRIYKRQHNAIKKAKIIIRQKRESDPLPIIKKEEIKQCKNPVKTSSKNIWTQINFYDNKY